MRLNIEILQSRIDALQSLANVQQVCSPITDCLRNIEVLRQELSEERERTQKIEFDLKVFKGENLNVDGFDDQNCKSEYIVANKESPERDEIIPEFQCTEDSPEEISLIINNKLGCLPFTQRFQYFRMENKWNTHFWSTQPENYQNKRFA